MKAQENLSKLIDSLAVTKNKNTSFELCLKIANELKYIDKTRAFHYIELGRKNAEEIDNEETWKEFYKESALIYYDLDAFDVSIENLLKEYEFYENSTDKRKFDIENQLGIIYARMNNQNKALIYFEKVRRHYQKTKDYEMLARIENNIGNLYLTNDYADSALIYFNKALKNLNKKPNRVLEIYLNTNLARSYDKNNQPGIAENYFQEALKLINDSVESNIISFVNQSTAEHYLKNGNYENAIKYSKIAEATEPAINSFSFKDILKTLYKAYLKKGDYKNASDYFLKYDLVRDSLNIEEKAVNIEKLKIAYDYKIKSQEDEIKNNKKRTTFIVTICGLIILLLVLGMLMIQYKKRLLKVKLENELKESRENELKLALELKNKELASKTIKETEQKEWFNILEKDLKNIQSQAGKEETKKALNELLKKIKQNSVLNNWEEFEYRFSNVYESFYERLNQLHPNLSAYDKRICALLKLNLSTKEIANLTKTSSKSIENTRTRLRKKLGLTHTDKNLSSYLSEL